MAGNERRRPLVRRHAEAVKNSGRGGGWSSRSWTGRRRYRPRLKASRNAKRPQRAQVDQVRERQFVYPQRAAVPVLSPNGHRTRHRSGREHSSRRRRLARQPPIRVDGSDITSMSRPPSAPRSAPCCRARYCLFISSFLHSTNWFLGSLCLATVQEVDRIAVLRGGLVAEVGTFRRTT